MQGSKHTIIVNPKSGKFLKNYDTFGKMDPLLMITIGTERHQTEVAKKQGKTPAWKSTLTYELTDEQVNDPEKVRVEVEAFDEDPNELEFIGRKAVTLKDIEPSFGKVYTIELFDGRNRSVGTVDIIFDYHEVIGAGSQSPTQNLYQSQTQKTFQSASPTNTNQQPRKLKSSFKPDTQTSQKLESQKVTHMSSIRQVQYQLVISPQSGKFLKNYDMFGKMDPLVIVHIDKQKQQTETAHKQGKTPVWKTALVFDLTKEQIAAPNTVSINFEAYDEDPGELEYIGRKIVTLEELEPSFNKPLELELFNNKNKGVGTITIVAEFRETIVQVPVSQIPEQDIVHTEEFAAPDERDDEIYQTSSTPQNRAPNYGGYDNDYEKPYNPNANQRAQASSGHKVHGRNQYEDQYYQDDYDHRGAQENAPAWKSRDQSSPIYQNERGDPQKAYDEVQKRTSPSQQNRGSSPQQLRRSLSPKKPIKHAIGTVVVKPIGGRFEFGVTDQQRLHLAFIHGQTGFKTHASEGSGRRPTWKDVLSFPLMEFDDLIVRLFDDNAYYYQVLSEGLIQLAAIGRRGNFHKIAVPLMSGSKKMGEIDLELEFYTDVFLNPVRMIPRIDVKRDESLSKKIRYINSDDVTKTLKIKSDNPDLVLVKTDTLTLYPNKFVEIRLKVFAPKMAESKCRVDVIVQETNTIEESLLFRVRGVLN